MPHSPCPGKSYSLVEVSEGTQPSVGGGLVVLNAIPLERKIARDSDIGDASMRQPARQRTTGVAIGLLCSVMGSFAAGAEPNRLIATCDEQAASANAALRCNVRVNGLAAIEDVRVAIKGQSDGLDAMFEPYDTATHATTTAYLIQLMPNARRATLAQMGDAVVTFTSAREGKRRFTAYTFAEGLSLVSDSGASNPEFVRQIIAIKPAASKTQLYKSALDAVDALAKEPGERKALVILGDGTSEDAEATHEEVVKAARDAGVTIHSLGYYDVAAQRSNFEKLSRLAEDTGGYAAEVKQGPGKDRDFTKRIVTSRFTPELLENGGTLSVNLNAPAGTQTLVFSATLANGEKLEAEQAVIVPAAPQPAFETTVERSSEPEPETGGFGWLALVAGLAVLLGGGAFAALKFRQHQAADATDADVPVEAVEPPTARPQDVVAPETTRPKASTKPAQSPPARVEPPIAAPPPSVEQEVKPAVYGWLETVDGSAALHPLRTTNVRVGRHRDNDICLQNDSISRRHAVLHYNTETHRFVITDLGAGNGVVVNKTKYKSRELNDGDVVELGEVRLRYRADKEFSA